MKESLLDKIKVYGTDIITISKIEDVHKLGYKSFDELIVGLKELENKRLIKLNVSSFSDSMDSPLLSDDILDTISSEHSLKTDVNDFKAVTIEIL